MIRLAKQGDRDAQKKLWLACFDDCEEYVDFFLNKMAQKEKTLLYELDGSVVGGLYIVDALARINGEEYLAAFIVGVATFPEYRHRGIAKDLMAKAYDLSNRLGYKAIYLYPFLHDFYRKLGYQTVSYMKTASFSANEFAASGQDGCYIVREAGIDDSGDMLEIYRQFTMDYRDCFVRSSMKDMIEEHLIDSFCIVAQTCNKTTGYAFYENDEHGIFVGELVYCDSAAAEALIGYICQRSPDTLIKIVMPHNVTLPGISCNKYSTEEYVMKIPIYDKTKNAESDVYNNVIYKRF